MTIDQRVEQVLRETRVTEFATINRDGGVTVRPLSSAWLPDSRQILLTTPAAYPQKVRDVRRDGRVALLYSDRTDSGLPEGPAYLVQGTASTPPGVAGAEEIEPFWRTVFGRHPHAVEPFADEGYRQSMDWYYWRLPIYVTPERIVELPAAPIGGAPAVEGTAASGTGPAGTDLSARIDDALARHPTAVLAARDADGTPYAARALVESADPTATDRTAADQTGHARLAVRPVGPFEARPGPASLLWHRHRLDVDDIEAFTALGSLEESGGDLTFTPERIPGTSANNGTTASEDDWATGARKQALRFLEREGLRPPEVDWELLRSYAAS